MAPAKELCGAKLTKREGTCGHEAGWGTPHKGYGRCKKHGGSTPNHVKSARREQAVDEARRLGLEHERHEEPGEVLMAELRRSRALTLHWDEKFVSGAARLRDSDGRLSVEGLLWQRERDRSIEVAKICEKLGLERRRVELAEGASREMVRALRNLFARLGVPNTPETHRVVAEEFGRLELVRMPDELPDLVLEAGAARVLS